MSEPQRPARGILLLIALIGAAINYGMGMFSRILALPFYFDSIGTMIVAAEYGLVPGLIAGAASNILLWVANEVPLIFVTCSLATALIVWALSRAGKLETILHWITMGVIVAVVNGILGALISMFYYGGHVTTSGLNNVVAGFMIEGKSLLEAMFRAGILTNLIDKPLSALAAWGVVTLVRRGARRG